jgi:hypothetical protein
LRSTSPRNSGAEGASSQVFSIIKPDEFTARLRQIREFLHRMGRETRQGEVACEFDGRFDRIRQFDSP